MQQRSGSFREEFPVIAALAEGSLWAALSIFGLGLTGGAAPDWALVALGVAGYARPSRFQAILPIPLALTLAFLTGAPVLSLLLPYVGALAATHLALRLDNGHRWSIEHLAFALVVLLAGAVVQLFFMSASEVYLRTFLTALFLGCIGGPVSMIKGLQPLRPGSGAPATISAGQFAQRYR